MAFPLAADGEAAADCLLAKPLVHVLAQLVFETLGIKAAALYGGEPSDVLTRLDDLDASPVHLFFDGILQGFDLCGGFFSQGFPFLLTISIVDI